MFFKRNGLSLVLLFLTIAFVVGQAMAGFSAYNEELSWHGRAPVALSAYLSSGHFLGALFENWESEFLQMGMYVLLTVRLRQAGSAESRPLDPEEEEENIAPGLTPWAVRRGGIWLRFYEHSLAIAFAVMFAASFALHLWGSWRHELDERSLEGRLPLTMLDHLASADFWFESMQNWQSEFLAVLSIVLLSIFLRQKNSSQSKPVASPNSQTGS
jgi:hypothetical protein